MEKQLSREFLCLGAQLRKLSHKLPLDRGNGRPVGENEEVTQQVVIAEYCACLKPWTLADVLFSLEMIHAKN